MSKVFYLLFFVTLVKGLQWKRYDGYTVYDIKLNNKNQAGVVNQIASNADYLTFGEISAVGNVLQVGIPQKEKSNVEHLLNQEGLEYSIYLEDVQTYLDAEEARLTERFAAESGFAIDINDFNTYSDIMAELPNMASRCPVDEGILCEVNTIGTSYEGRDINVLRIYKDEPDRPAFWVDSGIHSGEWLPPATNLKIMDSMTRNYTIDITVTELIDNYDWHFLPIMNPDGYEFTWDGERFWRKSRNINNGSECIGTDLNRNFDQMWMNAGSSDDPCSNNYAGSGAASEPETVVVQNEAVRLAPTLRGFVTLHSAAQMWLHPWGHVDEEGNCTYAEDEEWLLIVSNAAADAVESTFNTVWTRGNCCETIYPASGTTMDYAKGGAGIAYSCTPELRGPFDIQPEAIQLSYEEIWNGLVAMVQTISDNPPPL